MSAFSGGAFLLKGRKMTLKEIDKSIILAGPDDNVDRLCRTKDKYINEYDIDCKLEYLTDIKQFVLLRA